MVPARLRQRRSHLPLGNLKTCELIATQNGSDGERGDTAGLFHEYAGRRPEPGVAINKGSDEAQEKLGTDAQAGTTGSKRNTGVEGVFGKPQIAEPIAAQAAPCAHVEGLGRPARRRAKRYILSFKAMKAPCKSTTLRTEARIRITFAVPAKARDPLRHPCRLITQWHGGPSTCDGRGDWARLPSRIVDADLRRWCYLAHSSRFRATNPFRGPAINA